MDEKPTLQEILSRIAEKNGHLKLPENYPSIRKYSALELLNTYIDEKNGRKMAHVRCVCGNEFNLPYRTANQGYKLSCGCRDKNLQDEVFEFKKNIKRLNKRVLDLRVTGDNHDGVHGFLKVVDFVHKNKDIYWEVHCICGKILYMTKRKLMHTRHMHCGSHQCSALHAQKYTREEAESLFLIARRAAHDSRVTSIVRPVR